MLHPVAATLVTLWLAAPASADVLSSCQPVPGSAALWSKPEVRFVLVGEIHGTVEVPEIFRNLVCDAVSTKRPVVVGVERGSDEQPAIDRFMAPENHEAAVGELLASDGWNVFDGRSSQAMLALLEALRDLKLKGQISEVVAFDDRGPGEPPSRREERMAASLTAAAGRHPGALVIALTGNYHASKKVIPRFGYPFMALLLPTERTVSLYAADKGGETWIQTNEGCKPQRHYANGGAERGVVLSGSIAPMQGYDGLLSTGRTATASLPAIKDPPPPPACSKE